MAKAKETKPTATPVEKIDFSIRPAEHTVIQWHDERNVAAGVKGRFSDLAKAEALLAELKEKFPERTYIIESV